MYNICVLGAVMYNICVLGAVMYNICVLGAVMYNICVLGAVMYNISDKYETGINETRTTNKTPSTTFMKGEE
jgi:hypothetical protein